MPEILYQDIPPGANEKALAEGEGQSFWDGKLTRPQTDAPYATLEPGYWRLDGTRRLLEDQPTGEGYCSCRYSGEDGAFSQPVEVTVWLEKPCTATGLTLTFDRAAGEWCTRLEAEWYEGASLVAQEESFPTGIQWKILRTVSDFDRVKLCFYSTSRPGRFLRLEQLILGQQWLFTQEELKSVELYTQVDMSGLTLPGGTAQFELVLDPTQQLTFQKRQTFTVTQKGVLMGMYYLDQAEKTGPGQYRVECMDTIGLLEDRRTMGGLYSGALFSQVVQEILGEEFPATMEESFLETTLSGWIPAGSKRDALLQAAFGAGATVRAGADGTILLERPWKAADKVIPKENIFTGGTVTVKGEVTRVTVTGTQYQPGEREVIYQGDGGIGAEQVLTDGPCDEYQITGGTILEQGPNYLAFQGDGTGTVTVTGRKWTGCQTSYQRNLRPFQEEQDDDFLEAESTMVSPQNAQMVLERLENYALNRQQLQQTVVALGLEPGDGVTTEKAFDGQLVGHISAMTIHLTGNQVSELEILGRQVELEITAPQCGTLFAEGGK